MKEILKRIIKDFHRGTLPELNTRDADVPTNLDKIISIVGPRRAGKTYYLFQLMIALKNQGVATEQILYLNFEDERIELGGGQYDLIVEAYTELYPRLDISGSYFFFDEIQELDKWEKYVRRIYDTVTKKIFITGSNARFLSGEIATALRGRSISFEIMTLSFKEFLRFKGIDYQDTYSVRNSSHILSAFEEYLVWGGFPELVNIDIRFRLKILQEYFNVMIYRDLLERYDIKDVSMLKYLIKRLISSFTKEFSVNKLFNEIKSKGLSISKNMVYRLADQIFSVYMLALVEKYDPSIIKREMSNRKVYLYDTGLAAVTQYSLFHDKGKLLENVVFTQLRKKAEDVFFIKNMGECDFVAFQYGTEPLTVQVTERLSSGNKKREIKGLETARKKLSKCRSILLTGESSLSPDLPDWCDSMPVWKWLLQ